MQIEKPNAIWWLLIVPPMALLAVLAASPESAQQWREASHLPLTQGVYQWIFALAMLAHAGEAAFAWRLASRSAQAPLRAAWSLQTLILGYPSLRLLLARLRSP